jgi:hypothetical protein
MLERYSNSSSVGARTRSVRVLHVDEASSVPEARVLPNVGADEARHDHRFF